MSEAPSSCADHGHKVGLIGSAVIREPGWEAAVAAFEKVVDDFNIRGQREQINHPGCFTMFRFCTDCGSSLAAIQPRLRAPDWK